MGPLGFSRLGLAFLLALLAPNLLWTRYPPQNYDPGGEDRRLLVLERVGQVWVTCAALLSRDLCWMGWSPRTLWLLAAAALMVLYEAWWLRYFQSEQTMADFTAGLLCFPVAGASLPVLAFLLLGIYGRLPWLVLGDLVLGTGHIGIHLQHRRQARKDV